MSTYKGPSLDLIFASFYYGGTQVLWQEWLISHKRLRATGLEKGRVIIALGHSCHLKTSQNTLSLFADLWGPLSETKHNVWFSSNRSVISLFAVCPVDPLQPSIPNLLKPNFLCSAPEKWRRCERLNLLVDVFSLMREGRPRKEWSIVCPWTAAISLHRVLSWRGT